MKKSPRIRAGGDLIRLRCAQPPSPEGKAWRRRRDMFLKLKEARTARKISSVRAFFGDGRRRGRPHPASLRSATFPRGEGFGDFGKKQGAGRRTHPLARLLFVRRNQFLPPRATVLLGLERPSRLGNRCSRAAMAISTSSWTSQGVNAPTVTMSQGRRVA